MNSKIKVLIISKDPNAISSLQLEESKYELQTANNIKSGEFLLHEWQPQLLIINSQQLDCSSIFDLRAHFSYKALKIIYIDQVYSLHTEKLCFNSQFSHYLLSPNEEQIRIRIDALSNHLIMKPSISTLTYKNITLNINNKSLTINGIEESISPIHYKLLKAFLSSPDKLILRSDLLERVWTKKKCSTRSVDAQVSKLKKKLPQLDLENVYGEGYRLKVNSVTPILKIA